MADVLSQSEIDALLQGISSGEVDVEEMSKTEEKKVKDYDFARPAKFSKEHLRTLEMIFEHYGRLLSNNLPIYLRKNVVVEVANSETLTFNEFSNSLANPSILGIVNFLPLQGTIIMEMQAGLGFTFIDRMLGGEGRAIEKVRNFTDIEMPLKDECPVCHATGAQPGHPAEVCGKCAGKGQVVFTQQSLFGMARTVQTCPDCQGSGKIIRFKCSNCAGSGYVKSKKTIQVKVPAGIDNGQSIRLREMGEPGINGGGRGDLLVTVLVDKHPVFTRQEYDLYSSEPITFTQAALGGRVTLQTIDGPMEYDIQPGTQTNTKVKLRGKGVPTLRNKNVRGDHYVTLVVQVPDNLTEEQKNILNQYEQTTNVNARATTDSSGGFSFGTHNKRRR